MVDFLDNTNSVTPAYLAAPAEGVQGPGIVVLHSFFGFSDFFKRVCDRLADAGFVAAAPDFYNGAVASSVEEATQMVKDLDFTASLIKAVGAVEFLRIHPAVRGRGIGTLGFSMGGGWALHLTTVNPGHVKAAVTFYGTTEADFTRSEAAYQGHFAPLDPWEPVQEIQKLEDSLRAAGREVEFFTYPDTEHWFMEEYRPQYKPDVARLAWQRALDFLKKQLYEPEPV